MSIDFYALQKNFVARQENLLYNGLTQKKVRRVSKEIGATIKRLRKEAGLTLEELGKRIDVSRATAQRYESGGISAIPYENIEKMAKVFNVSPGYIMGWKVTTGGTGTITGVVDISDRPYLKVQEVALLAVFEKLNDEGKEKLLNYGYDLVEMSKYTREKGTSAS